MAEFAAAAIGGQPHMLSAAAPPIPAMPQESWQDLDFEGDRYPVKDPAKTTEFERKYPVDKPGSEAGDNARVWRVYRDRVNDMDTDTISGWNDTINFLLVFAGLFSAVMTAFLIELSKGLEADHQVYSSQALMMLVAHASGSNISQQDVGRLDPENFQPTTTTRLTNALWFPSLVLSLIVSMLSILAKQWIVMFSTRMRSPVAHMRWWVHRHRFFRDGIERWHLDAFVSSLSVALHLAVVLFLVGLNVRLYGLDLCSFIPVLVLTVLMLAFYIAATIAPLFREDCPTLTPLLLYSRRVTRALFQRNMSRARKHAVFDEAAVFRGPEEARDMAALLWMIKYLPAGHDVDTALDAFGPLQVGRNAPVWESASDGRLTTAAEHLRVLARSRLGQLLSQASNGIREDPAALSRSLRTSLSLEDTNLGPQTSPYLGLVSNHARSLAHDVFPLALALDFKMASEHTTVRAETLRAQLVALCGLLRRTSVIEDPDNQHPTASLTRRVVFNTIEKVSLAHPGLLRAMECTEMVLAFGLDPTTGHDAHVLTTNTLLGLVPQLGSQLSWRAISSDMTWHLRAIQVWSFFVTHYATIQQSGEPLSPEVDVWTCFADIFNAWAKSEEDKALSPRTTWEYLLPLSLPPHDFRSRLSPQAARVALGLVARAAAATPTREDGIGFTWSSTTANIIFNLLDVTLLATDRGYQLGDSVFHVAVVLHRLVQSSPGHAMVLASLRSSASPKAIWDDSPLSNLLVHRHSSYLGGTSSSLWRLVLACPIMGDEERHRIDLAALIAADLAILAQVPELGVNPAPGWAELVGDGFGERFLHSPYARKSAMLAIARHGRMIDPEWWLSTKAALLSPRRNGNGMREDDEGTWYPTAHGFATPATYIAAVENEGVCAACVQAVSEVKRVVQDPDFQRRFPPRQPPPMLHEGASTSRRAQESEVAETVPSEHMPSPSPPLAPRVLSRGRFSASDLALDTHHLWTAAPNSSQEHLLVAEGSAAPRYDE